MTGCPVKIGDGHCGRPAAAPASQGYIVCDAGHVISLNPDVPSHPDVDWPMFIERCRGLL